MKRFRSLVVLCALAAMPLSAWAQEHQPFVVNQGRVLIHFHESMLSDLGLELVEVQQTGWAGSAEEEVTELPLASFVLDDSSDLRVLLNREGNFVPYGVIGGEAKVQGGFFLSSPSTGKMVDYHNFRIQPLPVVNDGPGGNPDPDYFFMTSENDTFGRDFNLCYVKVFTNGNDYQGPDHDGTKLHVKAWDLVATETLARKLDRPDLVGKFLGMGKLEADLLPYDGDWAYPRGQNPSTPFSGAGGHQDGTFTGFDLDVKLGILASMTNVGHTGPFGSGRTGMSMATTSCNVGTVNVTWLAAMQENHPGIAMQLYRDSGDRFEQVGVSWIKHGFFALSSSQCTFCQNPSPGNFLGVGCSDTYGSGNNSDRFWLGPRDEWNAFKSNWTCSGSYFDGTPVNCVRDENGSGLNGVEHRLEAFDDELATPGSTYHYEAMYLVRGDENVINNIGSRITTVTQGISSYNFSTPGAGNPLLEGPAVTRWGDVSTTTSLEPDDGSVVLSVKTEDLGGGQWRYEYALFNWTLDRKLRSFSVPTCGGATDFFFRDIDREGVNDWNVTVSGGNITWEFPDSAPIPGLSKQAGPIEFGTLYNFGFTAPVAPDTRDAVLGVHEAGLGGDLMLAETLAPAGCVNLSADTAAPVPGTTMTFELRSGTQSALLAVIEAGGIPVSPAIIFPSPAVPFVGGAVDVSVFVPGFATGLDFLVVGADVNTAPLSTIQLTNVFEVIVR